MIKKIKDNASEVIDSSHKLTTFDKNKGAHEPLDECFTTVIDGSEKYESEPQSKPTAFAIRDRLASTVGHYQDDEMGEAQGDRKRTEVVRGYRIEPASMVHTEYVLKPEREPAIKGTVHKVRREHQDKLPGGTKGLYADTTRKELGLDKEKKATRANRDFPMRSNLRRGYR